MDESKGPEMLSDIIDQLKTGKMKLEFGNPEQIRAVRRYELDQDEESKPLWSVIFDVSGTAEVRVRANTKEEAEQAAQECFSADDMEIDDCSITSVVDITPKKE